MHIVSIHAGLGPGIGQKVEVSVNDERDGLQTLEGEFLGAVLDKAGGFVGYMLEITEVVDEGDPSGPTGTTTFRTIVHNPVTIVWDEPAEDDE